MQCAPDFDDTLLQGSGQNPQTGVDQIRVIDCNQDGGSDETEIDPVLILDNTSNPDILEQQQ